MFDYCYNFYKPGKRYFEENEIIQTFSSLKLKGYIVNPSFPEDPHIKNRRFIINDQETLLAFDLEKSGQTLGFYLQPAQKQSYGMIAHLAMPERNFEENPEANAELLGDAAINICYGLEPYFAWGDHELELDKLGHHLSFEHLGALACVNLFSSELIEKYGGLSKIPIPSNSDIEENYRRSRETNEYFMIPLFLSYNPVLPVNDDTIDAIKECFPGVILRGQETEPDGTLQRV